MLNHHTHPTDSIRDKKTNAFDTSMASLFRHHKLRASKRIFISNFGLEAYLSMNTRSIFWCLSQKLSLNSCHLHYLWRTSPLSIRLAWNSRIKKINCKECTFALDKSLQSRFCDLKAWIEEIEAARFVELRSGRLEAVPLCHCSWCCVN